ncbi:MAG: hypothetical protein PW788_07555 [Micavibrio sp.]|nr:hypothetical protein [Micavibrio sp.]
MKYTGKIISTLFCLLALNGCSPVMESMRPDPVDLTSFVIGEDRINVLAEVGAPVATVKKGKNSCDIYKLFTRGPAAGGKGAIAATEAVADVLTLGLAEVISTPAEAATKNSKHTVVFCYSPNEKLVSVNEAETAVDN